MRHLLTFCLLVFVAQDTLAAPFTITEGRYRVSVTNMLLGSPYDLYQPSFLPTGTGSIPFDGADGDDSISGVFDYSIGPASTFTLNATAVQTLENFGHRAYADFRLTIVPQVDLILDMFADATYLDSVDMSTSAQVVVSDPSFALNEFVGRTSLYLVENDFSLYQTRQLLLMAGQTYDIVMHMDAFSYDGEGAVGSATMTGTIGFSLTSAAVAEPGALALLACGLAGLAYRRRRIA